MTKRLIILIYILFLLLFIYFWLVVWVLLDYYLCELFPWLGICIPKWTKNYWYIYQEEIVLFCILFLWVLFSIFYWKSFKNKLIPLAKNTEK